MICFDSPKSGCNAAVMPLAACPVWPIVRCRKATAHSSRNEGSANELQHTGPQMEETHNVEITPSSTNTLPINSAWYFRSVCLLCSCPRPQLRHLKLMACSSWRCQKAGTETHSCRLAADFITAPSTNTKAERQMSGDL